MFYIMRAILGASFLILWLLTPSLVYADTAYPDSVSIDEIRVNRHLIETNDMLIYAKYNIAYATAPDDPVNDTFIFRLLDTDGVTQLGSNEAYPYADDGYGYGVISFYIGNATAPAWGGGYYIRVAGKPGAFDDPANDDFQISSGAYSSLTTQAGNRGEVESNVISLATDLEVAWNTTLLDQGAAGAVLSEGGEAYFRNTIHGLQAMCPELFLTQVVQTTYTERTWSTAQATGMEERFAGGSIGMGIRGWQDLLSVDFHVVASIPIMFAMIAVIYMASKMGAPMGAALIGCIAIAVGGAFMGWMPPAMVAIGSIVCIIYLVGTLVRRLIPT